MPLISSLTDVGTLIRKNYTFILVLQPSIMINLLIGILILTSALVKIIEATEFGLVQKWLSQRVSNETEYDKRNRPSVNGAPLNVNVTIHVTSLRSVSEETMDYKLEIYFRQSWVDNRVVFHPKDVGLGPDDVVSLHSSFEQLLWVPDTFLPNAIQSSIPQTESITHRSLLKLSSNGRVLWSKRLSITAECPMDLSIYPFDTQTCVLSIESYGTLISDLRYRWEDKNAVTINAQVMLPAFSLTDVIQKERKVTLSTGTYSRLEVCFVLKRISGFYFTQLFIPAVAIVCMAWFSFWVDETSSFGEMVQIMLSITFLYFTYSTMVPKVSYVKAMDIFLAICFFFVFFALGKVVLMRQLRGKIETVQLELKRIKNAPIIATDEDGNTVVDGLPSDVIDDKYERQLELLKRLQLAFTTFGHKLYMLMFLLSLAMYLIVVFLVVQVDGIANCRFD